jgi:hypothetical protein
LQDAKEIFHVVRESGSGTGELTYRGQEGHLYIEMKGGESGIPDLQRLGHEFKHGEQFFSGQLGFALSKCENRRNVPPHFLFKVARDPSTLPKAGAQRQRSELSGAELTAQRLLPSL